MVNHKYFVVSYQAEQLGRRKFNYDSDLHTTHHAFAAAKFPNSSPLELCVYGRYWKNELGSAFSPGAVLTFAESLFLTIEYEDWKRTSFRIGGQFRNGFRMFCTYGQNLQKETESRIRSLYSYQHHFGLGMEYVFAK